MQNVETIEQADGTTVTTVTRSNNNPEEWYTLNTISEHGFLEEERFDTQEEAEAAMTPRQRSLYTAGNRDKVAIYYNTGATVHTHTITKRAI